MSDKLLFPSPAVSEIHPVVEIVKQHMVLAAPRMQVNVSAHQPHYPQLFSLLLLAVDCDDIEDQQVPRVPPSQLQVLLGLAELEEGGALEIKFVEVGVEVDDKLISGILSELPGQLAEIVIN